MKHSTKLLLNALSGVLLASHLSAADENPAVNATNALGLDLYRMYAADGGNLCLSPYSIQAAFAMTTNGAAGKTLEEMRTTLHYPESLDTLNSSFSTLAADFAKRQERAAAWVKRTGRGEPAFNLLVANRLFGQRGYPFEQPFLDTVKNSYNAPLQLADFKGNFEKERANINHWVEDQTKDRIKDLLPEGSLNEQTSLVLVNALYFKAAWRHKFSKKLTKPAPFHLKADTAIQSPTMRTTTRLGHSKEDGYTAVTLPYAEGFVMLLVIPDDIDGLAAFDRGLTADKLASLARLPTRKVDLHLPKFKIEGQSIGLKDSFEKLGMKLAFDRKLANFDRMTSDRKLPVLYIDNAYHKTFIEIDEDGTEAAAATAVVMRSKSDMPRPETPVEVRADRPFFYAIMDTASRTTLFLGRVTDPR
jgi:serpin B